jgi:hypothetical protein
MVSQWRASLGLQVSSALILIWVLCDTPTIASRARAWAAHGWSGIDSDEARVVDYLSRRIQDTGSAKIGYEINFAKYMPSFHAIDMRYRVGAEMDVLFEYLHGVRNANRCGEGVAPDDEYRIVDTKPPREPISTRFDLQRDHTFALIQELGRFKVYERKKVNGTF